MFRKVIDFVSLKLISPAKWTFLKYFFTGRAYDLKPYDREYTRALMKTGVFLWVSRRETHLTTYLIGFADWLLAVGVWLRCKCKGPRPRFGFYSHAFMNVDDNEIVEAVAKGVQKVFFDEVFDCDAVAALVPRFMSAEEWAEVCPYLVEELKKQIGKKYDTVFNLENDQLVSCIELVRIVLKNRVKEYDTKFRDFEQMIEQYKNVTPQMLFESKSFAVVWEVRY